MRRLKNRQILSDIEIEHCAKVIPPRLYNSATTLIYEGHFPHVAFLLVEGSIEIIKRNKKMLEINRGLVLGLHELLNSRPCKYSVNITPGSKVCIIDKSTINELTIQKDNVFLSLIQDYGQAS